MRPREHFFTCSCGSIGQSSSIRTMKDGTKKRYIRCITCDNVWSEIVKEKVVVEHQGLWLGVNGVWYSPQDQERIKEVCRNIL